MTWAPREAQLRTLPEVVDVNSDRQDKGLQASLVIDRTTASRLGITPQLIDDTLYDAFGQRQVSIMYTLFNQYHVVMEVEPQYLAASGDSARYLCPDIDGRSGAIKRLFPLRADRNGSRRSHQGQFPAVTLSFNLAPVWPSEMR